LLFLEYLNLSLNSISSLPQGVFLHLNSLTDLNIRGNLIVRLNPDLFANTFQLTRFDASVNKINQIDIDTFDSLGQLESLSLVNNECVNENFYNVRGENSLARFVLPRLSRCFN
jgi:Leucine-rich repeat (LRR) protein